MTDTVTPIRLQGLREARQAAGLTQSELAAKVDVRQATISDLERGATTRIDLDLLDRICRAIGVTEPGTLFHMDPPRGTRKRT